MHSVPDSPHTECEIASARDSANLIRSRRTIHLFGPKEPPREAVLRAIDMARWAPNHRLTQPWRFYLLGRETASAIAHLNAEIVAEERGSEAANAKLERWLSVPGWVVVTCASSEDELREREDYAACCCAIQNFILYLWSTGIGVKWTTGAVTRDHRFYDVLRTDPKRENVVGLLWYGYPVEVPKTERQPVSEILTELP